MLFGKTRCDRFPDGNDELMLRENDRVVGGGVHWTSKKIFMQAIMCGKVMQIGENAEGTKNSKPFE
jgi:hypothetical protein